MALASATGDLTKLAFFCNINISLGSRLDLQISYLADGFDDRQARLAADEHLSLFVVFGELLQVVPDGLVGLDLDVCAEMSICAYSSRVCELLGADVQRGGSLSDDSICKED